MRPFFFVTFLLIAIGSFCQKEEIYRLTFSDTANFSITTYLDRKRPAKLLIIDTTSTWRTNRFWLKELNAKTQQTIKDMKNDEHHPYNFDYLFADPMLDLLVSDAEKKSLSQRAGTIKSKKIALKGKAYTTVPSSKNIRGFYFVTTEPVFTSDMQYAFIDTVVFYKEKRKQDLNETYFGTVCVVYKKQPGAGWRKIKVRNHLIL